MYNTSATPNIKKQPLAGKTILITGGATGIGAATARKHAEKGANVIITYAKSEKKAEELVAELTKNYPNSKFIALPLDFNTDDMVALIDNFMDKLKSTGLKIYGLVNNAGVLKGDPDSKDKTAYHATYKEMLNVNQIGPHFLTEAIINHMEENQIEGGNIIIVSSISDMKSFNGAKYTIYEETKAAITRIATSLADNFYTRVKGKINTVSPGFVDTDMQAGAKADPGLFKKLENASVLKYVAQAAEIAQTIYLLMCKLPNQTANRIEVSGGVGATLNLVSPSQK